MTGKFIITREMLAEQYGACTEGMELFDRNHPDGKGEYQTLLDEACAADRADFASWLLDKVGPTEDVLELDEINDPDRSIVFAGTVKIAKSAVLKSINAGGRIDAGWDINAGGSINAGGNIEAGDFFGIYAGLRVRITDHRYRTVRAKSKPNNLMCGEFEEAD